MLVVLKSLDILVHHFLSHYLAGVVLYAQRVHVFIKGRDRGVGALKRGLNGGKKFGIPLEMLEFGWNL